MEWGKPQMLAANCGNNAMTPKKRAPTVDNRIKTLERYFSVLFPGHTLGI
jgi:hypothetical protein